MIKRFGAASILFGGRNSDDLVPFPKGKITSGTILVGGEAVSAELEMTMDLTMGGKKGICCIGGKERAARRLRPTQAARPKICCTKDRCARMSPLGTARICPLASIAIASMPASVRFAVQKP